MNRSGYSGSGERNRKRESGMNLLIGTNEGSGYGDDG